MAGSGAESVGTGIARASASVEAVMVRWPSGESHVVQELECVGTCPKAASPGIGACWALAQSQVAKP